MTFVEFMEGRFPDGLTYDDALHVAWGLFCLANLLPPEVSTLVRSKEEIGAALGELHRSGGIRGESTTLVKVFENPYPVDTDSHWAFAARLCVTKTGLFDHARSIALLR